MHCVENIKTRMTHVSADSLNRNIRGYLWQASLNNAEGGVQIHELC